MPRFIPTIEIGRSTGDGLGWIRGPSATGRSAKIPTARFVRISGVPRSLRSHCQWVAMDKRDLPTGGNRIRSVAVLLHHRVDRMSSWGNIKRKPTSHRRNTMLEIPSLRPESRYGIPTMMVPDDDFDRLDNFRELGNLGRRKEYVQI